MHLVIVGNGIAGTTAARFVRKQRSDWRITLVSDETDEPFSRTALMYIYMGHLKQEHTRLYEPWFWEKNRIERVFARATNLDLTKRVLHLDNGQTLAYDKLLLATGSQTNRMPWPGVHLQGVHGLYHLSDLDAMEAATPGLQRAVVAGGGLIGVEMAEMFHSRSIPVTFLVRESSFWNSVLPAEESAAVNRHLLEHGIDLRLGTELREIVDDGNGHVGAVVTSQGETIPCGYAGITIGVHPNIDFLKNSGLELGKGILVDEYLQTSNPYVFAAGDCVELRNPQPGRRSIEAVWYTGRAMGQTVAATLCGEPEPYRPGIWFNSAKFFDLEYQVYGAIRNRPTAGVEDLYWEHPSGKKAVRIQYDAGTRAVLGFNLLGIRYRHAVCERWIEQGATIEAVLPDLALANFDPEFFPQYERLLVAQYNQRHGSTLTLSSKRSLSLTNRFLQNKQS